MAMKDHLQDVNMDKLKIVLDIKGRYKDGVITLEEARKELKEKVKILKPYEIALAEQELQPEHKDECRKENIQQMMLLFDEVMDTSRPDLEDDHPIQCYFRENDEMRKLLLSVEDLTQYPVIKNQWIELYEKLSLFKIHLSRKQNQLYSILERKGFDRPTTTMWLLDNFIRDEISDNFELINQDKDEEFIAAQQQMVFDIKDLMQKEETVLYPTSLAMITAEEFEDMKEGDREIGFAWIKVGDIDKKTIENTSSNISSSSGDLLKDLASVMAKHGLGVSDNQKLDVSTGKLTLEQINLIFRHLPVDLSYVDENDIVCFYSDTEHRVFPRSKNVIGREVQNCHPRSSVHIVDEIIDKFRAGEEDIVDFWINKPGFFVYIHYTAVRDENGKFRGILEMMQNCTHIRSLEGSRTLLTWGSGSTQEIKEASEQYSNDEYIDTSGTTDIDISTINEKTKLKDIFVKYPALKDRMIEINPKFKLLKTPLARVMLPKATIRMMSERSGMQIDELIQKIKELVSRL